MCGSSPILALLMKKSGREGGYTLLLTTLLFPIGNVDVENRIFDFKLFITNITTFWFKTMHGFDVGLLVRV